MKHRLTVFTLCLALGACSGHKDPKTAEAAAAFKPMVRLTLLPEDVLTPGKSVEILAKLSDLQQRTLLGDSDLDKVHTQKFHLLVIDSTLTDYQHIHPQATPTPGIYRFSFTPKLANGYRAWADVTPTVTHHQEFAMADLGGHMPGAIDKTETRVANAGGYHFTLSFSTPPKAGTESIGTIHVTDADGKPVIVLAPVMGAFAHIAGFYDDFRTVMHVHPLGNEPQSAAERGGPDLSFHMEPSRSGFVRLFVQVSLNGQELFVPFGVKVVPSGT